jgi:hypothetical protein
MVTVHRCNSVQNVTSRRETVGRKPKGKGERSDQVDSCVGERAGADRSHWVASPGPGALPRRSQSGWRPAVSPSLGKRHSTLQEVLVILILV